jgi:hypothetical protein
MNRADWLLLTATLPTNPSALRVRVWRALKATGAGTLREGVYLLPASAPTAADLWAIEKAVRESDAQAHMLEVQARDDAQEKTFRALFDRRELYLELMQTVREARGRLKTASEPELRKTLRALDQQFTAVSTIDFFPGGEQQRVRSALEALRQEIEQRISPGEPIARSAAIARRSAKEFQGKTWATRKRPWVDRLATAWLITRFIDRSPRFVWIDSPKKMPKGALGFDFDGATFSHVANKVTFEVVLETFALDEDPALARMGQLVHYIDVGGFPVEAAAGLEAVVRGQQAQHSKDDALLAGALPVFDALYAAMKVTQ